MDNLKIGIFSTGVLLEAPALGSGTQGPAWESERSTKSEHPSGEPGPLYC